MSNYSIINLKTDPELKKRAVKVAAELGVSISAVLNNELRRFASEQFVVFERQEVPNELTKAELADSKKSREQGEYHTFDTAEESVEFLSDEIL